MVYFWVSQCFSDFFWMSNSSPWWGGRVCAWGQSLFFKKLWVEGSVAPKGTTKTPSWESEYLDTCHWDSLWPGRDKSQHVGVGPLFHNMGPFTKRKNSLNNQGGKATQTRKGWKESQPNLSHPNSEGWEGWWVKEHSPPVTENPGTVLLAGGGGQSFDSKMVIKVQNPYMNCWNKTNLIAKRKRIRRGK